MKTTKEYLQLLREYKTQKAVQYGISRIGIFGSVARGEQTEKSDVDICVDLKNPSLFILVHIKEDLQRLFGKTVDIIRIRPEMDDLMKRDIMTEGLYV
ncbi:MAG: nucleotidyltransferase domain-containing protein [Prevotella sp.]|nr:nucleotidyltransferase domain-containing protein [Prevotella sp.]